MRVYWQFPHCPLSIRGWLRAIFTGARPSNGIGDLVLSGLNSFSLVVLLDGNHAAFLPAILPTPFPTICLRTVWASLTQTLPTRGLTHPCKGSSMTHVIHSRKKFTLILNMWSRMVRQNRTSAARLCASGMMVTAHAAGL
jgi:hypothetical protein